MGFSPVVVRGAVHEVASLVVEHSSRAQEVSAVVAHGLSSYGSWPLEHRLSSCGSRA